MKLALVFCAGAILGIVFIEFVPIQLDVQMRTQAKGSLQFYVDTGGGFNEIQSRRVKLFESPDFLHYRAAIPAHGIRAIRIDPLETPGKFELLAVQINYLFWHRQWHGHIELEPLFQKHDVTVESTSEVVFSGLATGNDPGLVITDMNYLRHWQLAATLFCALFCGLLLVVIRHLGGFNAVLTNKHSPLSIILLTATLLRTIYWLNSGLPSEPFQLYDLLIDEGTYFSVAQYIIAHGLKDYFWSEPSVMVTPINPLYIALMYSIFNSIDTLRAVNLFISILTIVLVYKLSKTMFNKQTGLLAAGICAVNGLLIEYSPTLMTEPLFLCLFMAAIYYLALTIGTPNKSRYQAYALASALFLTLSALTRSIVLLLPAFLLAMIAMLDSHHSWRLGKLAFPLLRRAALPLMLPIVIVGIVVVKNAIVFDRFIVATGTGSALWLGSRADTEGDDPLVRKRDYGVATIVGEANPLSLSGDLLLVAAGKKNVRQNPFNYLWWNIKKVGRLAIGNNLVWFGGNKNIIDWHYRTGQRFFNTAKLIFQVILSTTIAVYGVIGLITTRPLGVSRLILASAAVYFVIFSIPFLALQRYGLPLVMLLVPPAAAVIYGAWQAPGKLRRAALQGSPFITAIVLYILFMGN